ncbi:hypothetical protein AB1Y20_010863 [Prymnesium parvum]|uniref:Sulfotransferase n=1 Tax=Prymnesium parvum TaxID=97485 RepID=A0AB34IQN4_PRYPA
MPGRALPFAAASSLPALVLSLLATASATPQTDADRVVAAWVARLPASVRQLPPLLDLPSAQHPFVFHHLRKAGGTTIRRALYDVSRQLQLSAHIPCHTVACTVYSPPPRDSSPRFAILGGHYHRPTLQRWLGEDGSGASRRAGCLVMLRSTVDRVRSCWNFRYVQEPMSFGLQPLAPRLHAVDPRALNASLPTLRSVHGEGCNNEALRVLSSVGADEEAVGRLTAGEEWSPLAVGALDEALGQLSQCAVVLLDRCGATMRVIRHWMPWLAAYYDCSTQRVQVGTTARAALSADAERIIRTHNALDERVYAFAVRKLDAQLRLINGTLPPAAKRAVSSLPLDERAEHRPRQGVRVAASGLRRPSASVAGSHARAGFRFR